jgi:hypothetical protein
MADPDVAGIGVHVLQSIDSRTAGAYVDPGSNPSPDICLGCICAGTIIQEQAFTTGVCLDITAFIQFLRHQLRYYHLAIVNQLIMLTLIPLGCTLLRPS